MFRRTEKLSCSAAQLLMSPFIDSMATAEESFKLETHLESCEPCSRQLQSFISIRNLLVRVEHPATPEDLVLETRVKLSQARHSNAWERVEQRLAMVLKPVVVPAVFGVSLTALFFGILFGSLVSNGTVMANESVIGGPTIASYKPVRTTDPTMKRLRFAVVDVTGLEEPLAIELEVSGDGKVVNYQIIEGSQTPEIDTMLKDLLYYAQFSPATALGKPVASKVILSFVAVRS